MCFLTCCGTMNMPGYCEQALQSSMLRCEHLSVCQCAPVLLKQRLWEKGYQIVLCCGSLVARVVLVQPMCPMLSRELHHPVWLLAVIAAPGERATACTCLYICLTVCWHAMLPLKREHVACLSTCPQSSGGCCMQPSWHRLRHLLIPLLILIKYKGVKRSLRVMPKAM